MFKKLSLAISMYMVFCTNVAFCIEIPKSTFYAMISTSIPDEERSNKNSFSKYLVRYITQQINLEKMFHANDPKFLLDRIIIWKAPLEEYRNNKKVQTYLFELYDEIEKLKIQKEVADLKQKRSSRRSFISFVSSLF